MKYFKITETFCAETLFTRCILCAKDDAEVFDYLCGERYGKILAVAIQYDPLAVAYENKYRLDMIKNRTTVGYLGYSDCVWEEVTLTDDEALVLAKFDILK